MEQCSTLKLKQFKKCQHTRRETHLMAVHITLLGRLLVKDWAAINLSPPSLFTPLRLSPFPHIPIPTFHSLPTLQLCSC